MGNVKAYWLSRRVLSLEAETEYKVIQSSLKKTEISTQESPLLFHHFLQLAKVSGTLYVTKKLFFEAHVVFGFFVSLWFVLLRPDEWNKSTRTISSDGKTMMMSLPKGTKTKAERSLKKEWCFSLNCCCAAAIHCCL